MARTFSEMTLAIRDIYDRHGNLSYIDAIPFLKQKGLTPVENPGEKSENFIKWETVAEKYQKPDSKDEAALEAYYNQIASECEFGRNTAIAVIREAQAREAFANAMNSYNVTKFNYKKTKESGQVSSSQKPKARKLTLSAETPRPKHVVAAEASTAVQLTVDQVLEAVTKAGGFEAVQKKRKDAQERLDTLRAKLAEMQTKEQELVGTFNELQALESGFVALKQRLRAVA